jgi:hypothetical protein
MILTITILSAILLLWILLYPALMRIYRIFRLGQEQLEKDKKNGPDEPVNAETEASIVGKSSFTLCQPLPTTATPLPEVTEITEDGHNFAGEKDPAPLDIDYPLDKEPENDGGEIDEDDEAVELEEMYGKDVYYASGVGINELHKLKHAVESKDVTRSEKQEAGRILYENRETEIVEQLSSGKTAGIISGLIDLHIALQDKESEGTGDRDSVPGSEELENFDVTKFLKS